MAVLLTLLWVSSFGTIFYTPLFNLQADVKIPGLPLRVVMEAVQQATGKLKWRN